MVFNRLLTKISIMWVFLKFKITILGVKRIENGVYVFTSVADTITR